MRDAFDRAGLGIEGRVASGAQAAGSIDVALRHHVVETVVLDRGGALFAGELDLLDQTFAAHFRVRHREHLFRREIGPFEIRAHDRNAGHHLVSNERDIGVAEIDGDGGQDRIDDEGGGCAH